MRRQRQKVDSRTGSRAGSPFKGPDSGDSARCPSTRSGRTPRGPTTGMLVFEQDLAGSDGESANVLTPMTWSKDTLSALMRKLLRINEMVGLRPKRDPLRRAGV